MSRNVNYVGSGGVIFSGVFTGAISVSTDSTAEAVVIIDDEDEDEDE